METSVKVDDRGQIITDAHGQISTDPKDRRIDNMIGLSKHFNTLDYYTLHQKLNQLRLAFLTNDNQENLTKVVKDVLGISEEQSKDLYIVFGYKKTNATVKEDGNHEQMDAYAKANKTSDENIEYNAQGGKRSKEIGVNNLVVNIGFEESGDFLEISLMRFASPISIMYQTDSNGDYLFQELIDFWENSKTKETYIKCKELINKFKSVKKYEQIIREFQFYTLPNSNYFSITALDSEWLPAKDLTNLGPQVITNAGTEFYNEQGFEFSNNDDNSWMGISQFRDAYKDIMQISRIKMLTSNRIQGIDVSNHIDVGFPFVLIKMEKSSSNKDLMDERLLEEFLSDIQAGRPSKIRVVYLAKPKIALDSYLKKVHKFIFNGGRAKNEHLEFGNIFSTYKILEALFRNFDDNADILNPRSKITKVVKELCIESNYYLSKDVKEALQKAKENETWELAENILDKIILNSNIAKNEDMPICQDTGMACVFMEIGQDVHIIGGLLEDAINEGVRQGYDEGFLRKSVVKDPLDRVNTNDNTPAIIYYDIVQGDKIKITVSPKGFGSENMSRIKMLKPSDGLKGVKDFIIETVMLAGPNPCPPIVIGVGIGGTFDKAAYLAKKALIRPLDKRNSKEFYSNLEEELLEAINKLGIGPQGFGGKTTALGVNIETYPTHIAGLPVAVNINCHVTRHKTEVI